MESEREMATSTNLLQLEDVIISVDRYLRKHGYLLSLLNDKEFHELQDILEKKQKQLKAIGKGNKPNSTDPPTDEQIDEFYRVGVLRIKTPRALLSTDWMNNCIYFEMFSPTDRTVSEFRSLKRRRVAVLSDEIQYFFSNFLMTFSKHLHEFQRICTNLNVHLKI